MDENVICGAFVREDVTFEIVCYPEEGDIVVMFDDLGPILLENVIVHNPRHMDSIPQSLFDAYDADGVFATDDGWVSIKGTTVSFHTHAKPMETERTVETSFNISYEE